MKKFGLLLLAVVLALGTMGVGYAMWYEDLYIDGTVYTGELDVGYYCTWGVASDSEAAEKDFSSITRSFSGDGKTMYITINNAYPCIDYNHQFCVVTAGTIPVHFGNWVINRGTMPAGATIEVTPDLYGVQKHPGDHTECNIHVHLDNTATENATYTFSIDLTAYQYNEFP